MQGVLGIGAAIDPTKQPAPGSFWVFVFLLVAMLVLIFSFLRHMRRAQQNLGPAREPEDGTPAAPTDPDLDRR